MQSATRLGYRLGSVAAVAAEQAQGMANSIRGAMTGIYVAGAESQAWKKSPGPQAGAFHRAGVAQRARASGKYDNPPVVPRAGGPCVSFWTLAAPQPSYPIP